MNYLEFIESKIALSEKSGFHVELDEINPVAKPHQKTIIQWDIAGGKRAIFAKFGLGKGIIQLESCRLIIENKGGRSLIVCPLDVMLEFRHDAKELLKFKHDLVYVRNDAEIAACKSPYMITNYERVRDGQIDVNQFKVICLDEAAILRGFGTKTFQTFLPLFKDVEYRFVATATPSPNRYKELIHYAGFLGVMDTGQALTRFFERDSTKASNLTLMPHMEKEFRLWLNSWACFVNKPSDLGFSDEGYDLPKLNIHWHRLSADHTTAGYDKFGQGKLLRDSSTSLPDAAKEKRDSIDIRVAKMMEIVKAEPDRHFILWHDLEAERLAIKKALPEAAWIYGKQDPDERSQTSFDFAFGKHKYLSTKKRISGCGCNYQRFCSASIFVGIDAKFNDFIQAVHRVYRFLQKEEVDIHIIYLDSEENTKAILEHKWKEYNELQEKQSDIIKKYGLNVELMCENMKRTIGIERKEVRGERYIAANDDTHNDVKLIKDCSIDLLHTSIPFGNHYEYSPSYNDFGHNKGNEEFFRQMDFVTPEWLRILKPGRVAAIHVKDRVLFGNATGDGMPTIDPFSDLTVMHFIKHGFKYFGRITIETDVVRENNQTYRLGYSEQCKDGSKMGVGCPEYLLLFRKLPSDTSKAYADEKISKSKSEYSLPRWQIDAAAKWNSSGNRFLTPEEIQSYDPIMLSAMFKDRFTKHIYNYHDHVEALEGMGVLDKVSKKYETMKPPSRLPNLWHDINRMRTLNGNQARKNLVQHICPLQFDIVERVIVRFSNKDEWVYDPFAGLFTVPYMAVKLGRKGRGVELNPDYFFDGVNYTEGAEREYLTPSLFDFEEIS
ncbi:MAG: DNA methyltransferase [Victivallaceae bacterium]|nr:DNA methyltransferase [Victivallaceae bacterium]